jgi:hypothetical protein
MKWETDARTMFTINLHPYTWSNIDQYKKKTMLEKEEEEMWSKLPFTSIEETA